MKNQEPVAMTKDFEVSICFKIHNTQLNRRSFTRYYINLKVQF